MPETDRHKFDALVEQKRVRRIRQMGLLAWSAIPVQAPPLFTKPTASFPTGGAQLLGAIRALHGVHEYAHALAQQPALRCTRHRP